MFCDGRFAEPRSASVRQSLATVGPYLDAKKIALIKNGEAILTGMTARSRSGQSESFHLTIFSLRSTVLPSTTKVPSPLA
jgi:hypothetical protein